ncbi:MAG: hypothetical protein H6765_08785 [Candidatus Peribacteria bacterium]|nr:MAG: hypothetical protein H6765_08785 [Candidatus Peribacteria bacterium]
MLAEDVRGRAEFALKDFVEKHYFSDGKRKALLGQLLTMLTKYGVSM